jgi:hypothetical protein
MVITLLGASVVLGQKVQDGVSVGASGTVALEVVYVTVMSHIRTPALAVMYPVFRLRLEQSIVTLLAPVPEATPVPVAEVLLLELKKSVAEFPPPVIGWLVFETVMVMEVIFVPKVGTWT